VGAIAGKEQVAITHRLGNEAAQWRNGFFDRRPGDDTVGHVFGTPRPEFLPEAVVRPVFEPRFEIALNVVSAQHRFAHGRKRKPAAVIAITKVRERRRLRHNAKPSERIALFICL